MANDIMINLTQKEWRSVRNQVIFHLHDELGLMPADIIRISMPELYPGGFPLEFITILNGYFSAAVSDRLRESLRQLNPQPALIMDYPITQKVITNKPNGRPLTAATVGRILRSDKPF